MDEDLVSRFLGAREGLTTREAAEGVSGVTADDVSRWRRGEWTWLSSKKRRALERFLANGVVRERGPGYGRPEQGALDLFGADFDQLAKYVEGIPASDPEEARLRKLDVLEGLRRVFSAYGPVPGSWYRLKEMVEKGEL